MGSPYAYSAEIGIISAKAVPFDRLTEQDLSACREDPTSCCVRGQPILDFKELEGPQAIDRYIEASQEIRTLWRDQQVRTRREVHSQPVWQNYKGLHVAGGIVCVIGLAVLLVSRKVVPLGYGFRVPFFLVAELIGGGSLYLINRRHHRLEENLRVLEDDLANRAANSIYSHLPRTEQLCP